MKRLVLLFLLLTANYVLFAQTDSAGDTVRTVTNEGIGLGSAIAVVASWSRNESILWAILHGILSWIYVIYFAITRKD